jgi:hypothetical protein
VGQRCLGTVHALTRAMSTLTRPRPPANATTACCAPFDPKPWDDVEFVWEEKPFVKEHVTSLFHIPLNMAAKVEHASELIEQSGRSSKSRIMLCDERSPWSSDLFIEASGPVPGAEMVTISGRFLTRVYDGPYRDAAHWVGDMKQHVAVKGLSLRKLYFGFTTCPRCAKTYGHNYVVLFADVDGSVR